MAVLIVAVVGISLTLLLLLNAVLSFVDHRRPVLSWLRVQACALSALGTVATVQLAHIIEGA